MSAIEKPRRRSVQYPESDGKPLGESDRHRILMTDLIFALSWFLRQTVAYVAGNLFFYFEEGNPRAVVAPDVFVVLGAQPHERRIYKLWEEDNRLPNVVIELTSKKTQQADQTTKPELYARLGVQEYFLFDPYGEYLRPTLQGYTLVNGHYERLRGRPLRSEVLGLELWDEANALRLLDPATGEFLPTANEDALARRAAERRLRLANVRVEEERVARTAAEGRAAAEAERAQAAEAEVARLRALLEQSGRSE